MEPQLFQSDNGQSSSKKKYFFGASLLLLLLVGLVLSTQLTQIPQILKSRASDVTSEVQPEIVQTSNVFNDSMIDHPKMFYSELTLSSETNQLSQRSSGVIEGDPVFVLIEKPSYDESQVIFKIEVYSESNEQLLSAWIKEYRELVEDEQKNINFEITTGYVPKGTVRIYRDNGDLLGILTMPATDEK